MREDEVRFFVNFLAGQQLQQKRLDRWHPSNDFICANDLVQVMNVGSELYSI